MDIGKKLQSVRMSRGLSQRELAARAGLTNGAISLIETNKSSPSIASLKRLLDAIPMSMAEFFSEFDSSGRPRHFFRAADFIEIAPQDAGMNGARSARISLRQLGVGSGAALQVLHERYPPSSDTGPELLSHDGEEAGVVIAGEIEVTVDGETRTLRGGDGYLFQSRLPHRFRNASDAPCEIVSACTPPTF